MSTEDSKASSSALCEKVPTEECKKDSKQQQNNGTCVSETSAASPAPPRENTSTVPSRQARRGDSSSLSEDALEKKTFLLFVKILFKLLKENQGDEFTNKAKRVVMECRRHNQQNNPAFIPLMEALERHLRLLVGEKIWARAHFYLHHYLSKEQESRTPIEPRPLVVAAKLA